MGLPDLSDPGAVRLALEEFIRLGRDRFLKEHGFRRAKVYFLKYEGKLFDSKAVVGVAHGYQFPQKGPLHAVQFSGGDATVKQKLEELGFDVEKAKQRSPDWSREELILALDLYKRRWPQIGKTDPELVALSALLNRLPIHFNHPEEEFRNVNGVHMKLAKFARLDPSYPGEGLKRGNKLESVIWEKYGADPISLSNAVDAIKAHTEIEADWQFAFDDEDDIGVKEGRLLYRAHKYRERSNSLIRKKKSQAMLTDGKLSCEVCGFDFKRQYVGLDKPFIECHHLIPLAKLRPNQRTKLKDLALVCANCHTMLHKMDDPSDIESLRQRIAKLYSE